MWSVRKDEEDEKEPANAHVVFVFMLIDGVHLPQCVRARDGQAI